MATAGVSGVSGVAAGTRALSLDQLRDYLLTWGIPDSRVEQRAERLAGLGVTLQGLAAAADRPNLDVLESLLTGKGVQSTEVDTLDACSIQAGVTKAVAGVAGGVQLGAGATAGAAAASSQAAAGVGEERMAAMELTIRELLLTYSARVEDAGTRVHGAQPALLEDVLADVPPLRKPMDEVIEGLTTTTIREFGVAARTKNLEPPVQELFNSLSTDLCNLGGRRLHSCDTHSKGFPLNPTGKVDVILSTEEKPAGGQVLWSTVVAVIEVKKELTTTLQKEGYGQLLQRAEAVLGQQPQRTWVLGVLADGVAMAVVRFFRIGAGISIGFRKSQLLPLSCSPQSVGLRVLARLMLASASELGYKAPAVHSSFSVEKAGQEWQVEPQQVLQERGTPVYRCTCSTGFQKVEAVLKVAKSGDEASIIEYLNARGVSGTPTLWHSGELDTGESYLIIQPYGRSVALNVNEDFSADRIFLVAKDVATTLVELAKNEVWHTDVAPSNIIVDDNGKAVLLDFHLAQRAQVAAARVTRRRFMSLDRLWDGIVTLSGELESLFYTVLYWCSNGHLAWDGDQGQNRVAYGLKHTAMTRGFEEEVLSKCCVPDEARHVLRRLKELYFRPQYPNGYNNNVAAADFLSALS